MEAYRGRQVILPLFGLGKDPVNYTVVMSMDKSLRKFASHAEQQKETYRYWQNRPIGERIAAAWEATAAAYAFKGIRYDAARRSEATLNRIQRARG